jgi:hypothetical protein
MSRGYLRGVRLGNRKPALAFALFGGGAAVVIVGVATMQVSAIAVGLLTIVAGWLVVP